MSEQKPQQQQKPSISIIVSKCVNAVKEGPTDMKIIEDIVMDIIIILIIIFLSCIVLKELWNSSLRPSVNILNEINYEQSLGIVMLFVWFS